MAALHDVWQMVQCWRWYGSFRIHFRLYKIRLSRLEFPIEGLHVTRTSITRTLGKLLDARQPRLPAPHSQPPAQTPSFQNGLPSRLYLKCEQSEIGYTIHVHHRSATSMNPVNTAITAPAIPNCV